MRKKKKHIPRLFKALFTLFLAVAIYASLFFMKDSMSNNIDAAVSNTPIERKGLVFLPVNEVLLSCGYTLVERKKDFFAYYNEGIDSRIHINLKTRSVGKSGFMYDLTDKYVLERKRLYAEKDFLSELICMNIEVDHDSILLSEAEVNPYDWINLSNGLVAHAGGGVGKATYTNSYEAIRDNYSKGHRVFELDFRLTTDGYLAAIHDWNKDIPMSLADFKKTKARDYFTSIGFDDVAKMMLINKDMYIVTDTKSFEYSAEQTEAQFKALVDIAKQYDPSILKRVIVQIYNEEMYDLIEPFQFDNIAYTLYASGDKESDVVKFVEEKNIKVVVMAPERLNKAFLQNLADAGAVVYVHTINDLANIDEYAIMGVWGFYTDFLSPVDLQKTYHKIPE